MIILVNGFKHCKLYFLFDEPCILRSCANRFLPNMAPARLLFQLRKHTVLYTTLHYFCNKGDFKIIYVASIGVYDCLHWTKLMSLGKMRWYLPGCLILAGWAVQSSLLGRLFPGNSLETSRKGAVFVSTAHRQDPAGWKWSRLESHLGEQNKGDLPLAHLGRKTQTANLNQASLDMNSFSHLRSWVDQTNTSWRNSLGDQLQVLFLIPHTNTHS